jgi:hypothetical protein
MVYMYSSCSTEVRCLCLANKCNKKQQSIADGSADLDGFPVREGEALTATCIAWFRLKEGWLRPGSIPDALRLFNYFFRVQS